jgi:hypothetical protein
MNYILGTKTALFYSRLRRNRIFLANLQENNFQVQPSNIAQFWILKPTTRALEYLKYLSNIRVPK